MTPYTQLQTCLPAQPHTWLDTGVAGFNRDFPLGNSTGFPPLTAEGSLRSNGEPTGVPLAGAKGDRGGSYARDVQIPPNPVNGGVNGGVNTESAHFLQLIQAQLGSKTSELVAQTGKPQRTVERWLKQLKDSQTIEFRGAPKTGGYYCKSTRFSSTGKTS